MHFPLFRYLRKESAALLFGTVFLISFASGGCAALFGWDIHAPGILSQNFSFNVRPSKNRIGLYLDPAVWNYISTNRGGRFADPQTYHVGEAYAPMIIEGFQSGFEEFIFFEVEPTAEMVKQYGIEYTAAVRIQDFGNRVTMKGQAVQIRTETVVLDGALQPLARFVSLGSSDAEKIFAKKGGPEVNLNAAIENNIIAIVQYMQDSIRTGRWSV